MTVNELLGLPADASQAQIQERTLQLVQNERDLLEVTGSTKVAEAFSFIIAQKEAASELEKTRAALTEWEQREAAREASERSKKINTIVEGAILAGRISVRDTERQAQLVKHGEKFGIESLEQTVALMTPRPVRVFQAPMPDNSEAAQAKAVADYKKAHPEASTMDAYVALAEKHPALFSEEA